MLSVPTKIATPFAMAFRDTGLIFPEVRTFVLGPHCQLVLPMMPKVSIVASNGWQLFDSLTYSEQGYPNFMTVMKELDTLKRLEISSRWKEPMVKGI
jgi:hypothetical protein